MKYVMGCKEETVMLSSCDRKDLRIACHLFGGIKPVARLAGMNDGNLSKWFRGQPTLSEAKQAQLMAAIGLADGEPDIARVHEWSLSSVRHELGDALRLYFPNGAEVARASWSQPGLGNVRKILSRESPPEVYAMTDGRVRAVLRLPTALLLQKKNMGDVLQWRGGQRDAAMLDLESGVEAWEEGPLSIMQFDGVWNGINKSAVTLLDIDAAIQENGLTYAEALRRIEQST